MRLLNATSDSALSRRSPISQSFHQRREGFGVDDRASFAGELDGILLATTGTDEIDAPAAGRSRPRDARVQQCGQRRGLHRHGNAAPLGSGVWQSSGSMIALA